MSSQSVMDTPNSSAAYVSLAKIASVCKHNYTDDREFFDRLSSREKSLHQRTKDLIRFNPVNYTLIFQELLQNGGGINYQIPVDSPIKCLNPHILGYTALHFAVFHINSSAVDSLLDLGADVTVKNHDGLTPLHVAVQCSYAKSEEFSKLVGTFEEPVADQLLDAHVRRNNPRNPKCKKGISHFHIACMLNHVEAVKFFIQNGVYVNEKTNPESDILPGYTALHFAARYCSVDVIRILLEYGADKHPRDAKGMTPLYLLLDYRMQVSGTLNSAELERYPHFKFDLFQVKKAVQLFTFGGEFPSILLDDRGLTCLHVLCTEDYPAIMDSSLLNVRNVNAATALDSPFCPGYTPLHFAAHFNTDTFIALLKHGADIEATEASGLTPLDIFAENHSVDELHTVLTSQDTLKDARMSNNEKLVDVIYAMRSAESFRSYLLDLTTDPNVYLPAKSPVWPRCNLGHVAMKIARRSRNDDIFNSVDHSTKQSETESASEGDMIPIVRLCFNAGVDFCFQDLTGTTPFHYGFRRQKRQYVRYLADRHWSRMNDRVDIDNLSHSFIIACTDSVNSDIEKFLKTADLNRQVKADYDWDRDVIKWKVHIPAGSTHLHAAMLVNGSDTVQALLDLGADPTIKSSEGLNPIHLSYLLGGFCEIEDVLADPKVLKENVVADGGLSHLHAACCQWGDSSSKLACKAIESYLKLGADVNMQISNTLCYSKYEMFSYNIENGFTPLHFAMINGSYEVVQLLIRYGADINVKSETGLTPLHLALKIYLFGNGFIPKPPKSRKIVEYFLTSLLNGTLKYADEMGMTLLHLACACLNEEAINQLLKTGSNVNARVNDKSTTVPGYTPLHILMEIDDASYELKDVLRIAKMLLSRGADVNVRNVDKQTPIHLCYGDKREVNERLLTLLQNHKISSVNPVDGFGVSHFHLACLAGQCDVVEEFLKNGVDVNHATDFFGCDQSGYTALHFVMRHHSKSVIDVLLEYGADVEARDQTGSTPLLTAFKYVREEEVDPNIETLIRKGKADVNARCSLGKSLLETLYTSDHHQEGGLRAAKLALSLGHRVNTYNPVSSEGVLARLLHYGTPRDEVFTAIVEHATDLLGVDEHMGQGAIHNVVSLRARSDDNVVLGYHFDAIRLLLARQLELDAKNRQGETPLHVAVAYDNFPKVKVLLLLGADVNAADNRGHTPYHYSREPSVDPTTQQFFDVHVLKLLFLGLEVCGSNRALYNLTRWVNAAQSLRLCVDEIQLRSMHIVDGTFTLRDLLTERAAMNYAMMPRWKREAIDRFVRDKGDELLNNFLGYLANLQLKKAKERAPLIEPAKNGVATLAGEELPDPCSEAIVQYLTNEELKVLIAVSSSSSVQSSNAGSNEQADNSCKRRKLGD